MLAQQARQLGHRMSGQLARLPFSWISQRSPRAVKIIEGRLPSSEKRPHFSPPSTLSSRNE
jgi:hypothetical protein